MTIRFRNALGKNAKAGRYAVKIEQLVSPAANVRRLARQAYPVKALFDFSPRPSVPATSPESCSR